MAKSVILITGDVSYWNAGLLREAFGRSADLVVLGEGYHASKNEKGITCYSVSVSSGQAERIFANYTFDRAVYLSSGLTLHRKQESELEQLHRFFHLCKKTQVAQVACFLPAEVCSDVENGTVVVLRAAEELFHYYAEENWLPAKLVRTPFLTREEKLDDFFQTLFGRIERGEAIVFPENEKQRLHMADMRDVTVFIGRMFDLWDSGNTVLNMFGNSEHTFGELAQRLNELKPEAGARCGNRVPLYQLELGPDRIRSEYGWFAQVDPVDRLPGLYEQFIKKEKKTISWKQRALEWLRAMKKPFTVLELLGVWLLVELLSQQLGNTTQFRMIDVRLLLVLMAGSVYGIQAGLFASFLESVALCFSYAQAGMNWQTLFYDPSNWVPFLLYMLVGAVCGYIKLRGDNTNRFLSDEYKLLMEKYEFLTKLYNEVLANKNQYKKQIIGSRDSFGKIFEVVKRLNTEIPEKIFAETIPVLEDILENHSIAVYSVKNGRSLYGRLEVSSHGISRNIPKSIRLQEYAAALESMKNGEVWFNRELMDQYPVYMAGIENEGELAMVIMVYHVEYDQVGMYYANLLRILCGLIEESMLTAWRYQKAVSSSIYIGETLIANETYFLEQLKIRHQMAENRISSYKLVQVLSEGRSLEEMDELLGREIRETDLMGLGTDGNLYLLLSQVDSSNVVHILNRLKTAGLSCQSVETVGT